MSKRVILTAHPDDEVLFCGGLPLRFPGDWTVICASIPRRDPIRAFKFFDACEVLGVNARLFPAHEPHPSESISYLEYIDLSGYDHIVTHGIHGEYGHTHHKDVSRYVLSRYAHKKITAIGYRPGSEGAHKIKLTEDEKERKMAALMKYDHCLPYEGRDIPKWEALLHRYCTKGDLRFDAESYDGDFFT